MADTLVQKDAPDFKAQALVGKGFKEIQLADYKGKWVALFFYPLDFTFVCPTEIVAFSDAHAEFKKLGCEILGCSGLQFSHLAWTRPARKAAGDVKHPLLADVTKKRPRLRRPHRGSRHRPARPLRHQPRGQGRLPGHP